jgi:hypothetical protein
MATAPIATCAFGAPYASNIVVTGGTNVSFILNEPADSLTYSINGGPAQSLSGATKGLKNFVLGSPTDTFSITASKTDSVGYTVPTGGTIATDANGLSQPTAASGFRLLSTDTDNLVKFNSPRGVDVAKDPNSPNFGTSYIANSAAGTAGGRTLGDGLYGVRADQSDAFGFGNTAQNGGITQWGSSPSASAPFRLTVGADNNVYAADFSDATGTVWRLNGDLTANANPLVLTGVGGPTALPAGQNHGSTTAVYLEGSTAGGNLKLYTLDEDLTSAQLGGPAGDDRNSLWRYDIDGAALPFSANPTKVNTTNVLLPAATSDMQRGADGKFYLAQNRAVGAENGLVVLDSSGVKVYDSLTDSRTLLGNPTANDILRNILGMAVSPDQKFLAVLLNNSDVAIVPLVNGIPDLANRLDVDTGTNVISGRDIAFDAVDNLHYVSSGQGLYRVLSPGGFQTSTTSWNGTSYSLAFAQFVPEPGSLAMLGLGAMALANRRRRR